MVNTEALKMTPQNALTVLMTSTEKGQFTPLTVLMSNTQISYQGLPLILGLLSF